MAFEWHGEVNQMRKNLSVLSGCEIQAAPIFHTAAL